MSRASSPSACLSAAWNGRGSSSNSTCPFFTSWPSRNATCTIGPLTWAWTATVWIGSTVPVAASS